MGRKLHLQLKLLMFWNRIRAQVVRFFGLGILADDVLERYADKSIEMEDAQPPSISFYPTPAKTEILDLMSTLRYITNSGCRLDEQCARAIKKQTAEAAVHVSKV